MTKCDNVLFSEDPLCLLQFLRTLTSLDETYGLASEARFTLSFLVIEGRLVEILLSMLAALGPIASRRWVSAYLKILE